MEKRATANICLGIREGELVFLEDIFEHGDSFKGCTGFSMRYVSPETIEANNNVDNIKDQCEDLWIEAVKARATTDSLDDYVQQIIDDASYNGLLYPFYDDSFQCEQEESIGKLTEKTKQKIYEYFDTTEENFNTEVGSCGRCIGETSDFELCFIPKKLLKMIIDFDNGAAITYEEMFKALKKYLTRDF